MSCNNCNDTKTTAEDCTCKALVDHSKMDDFVYSIVKRMTDAYACGLEKGTIEPAQAESFFDNINVHGHATYDESTNSYTYSVTSKPTLIVSLNVANVTCFGLQNGTASATVNGGCGPYVLAWADSLGATVDPSSLFAGSYTLTVTDSEGNTKVKTFVVTEPVAITAAATTTTDTATVTAAGGTEPYTYLWSDSQTTQTATGLAAGTYSVTVTDANGCTVDVTGITIA